MPKLLKAIIEASHSFKSIGTGVGLALPWTLSTVGVFASTPPTLVYGGFALVFGGIGWVADRYITLPAPDNA